MSLIPDSQQHHLEASLSQCWFLPSRLCEQRRTSHWEATTVGRQSHTVTESLQMDTGRGEQDTSKATALRGHLVPHPPSPGEACIHTNQVCIARVSHTHTHMAPLLNSHLPELHIHLLK